MAEVQRAVAAAMAESRANERLRSQRYLDSLTQQQQRIHQHGRPGPFLRLTGDVRSSGSHVGSTTKTNPSDETDKESSHHPTTGIPSVSLFKN